MLHPNAVLPFLGFEKYDILQNLTQGRHNVSIEKNISGEENNTLQQMFFHIHMNVYSFSLVQKCFLLNKFTVKKNFFQRKCFV